MNELDDAVKLAQWFVAQPRLYTDNACVLAQQLLRMVEENVRLTAKIGAMAATDQAEQRINFAAGNAAADDPGCTKESVRAAAAIMASSRPSLAARAEAVEQAIEGCKASVCGLDAANRELVAPYLAALSAAATTIADVPAMVEAFKDATAHLAGATSAYETYAGNSKRAGVRDAVYSTRLKDFQKATERARAALRALDGEGDGT